MPFNLLKTYPELLELINLSPQERIESLKRIYKRDIVDNKDFKFRKVQIYPIKSDGELDLERQFHHLTCEMEERDERGTEQPRHRRFDIERSSRLHWLCHHVHERTPANLMIKEVTERDLRKRQDVVRTYIYDFVNKYVIVMENQRNKGYYLLTAYYLNRDYGEKAILKKLKKGRDIKAQGSI